MRKLLLSSLVALLVPAAAQAQFQLGLRVGYGLGGGDAFKDNTGNLLNGPGDTAKMSDSLKAQIPIQLDASYKITPDLAAGLYASYGFAQLNDKICSDAGISCDSSGSVVRVGAQGVYSFNQVGGTFIPWAGLFVGWEQAAAEYKIKGTGTAIDGESTKFTLSGWELGLQVGGDYKVSDQFSIGPYLTFSFAQYTSRDITLPSQIAPLVGPLDLASATHNWFGIGVLGKFDL